MPSSTPCTPSRLLTAKGRVEKCRNGKNTDFRIPQLSVSRTKKPEIFIVVSQTAGQSTQMHAS
ncbi:hypothetical protein DXM29_07265 [Agrobacterium tumefaciens]|nr:hypothetical protein DXM29_07265 [Agrobacterium tumefaciens]